MKKTLLLIICLLGLSNIAIAQKEADKLSPINTDRRSQGTGTPVTLPKGYFQLETGVLYSKSIFTPSFLFSDFSYSDDPLLMASEKVPFHDFQLPNLLIRYGLTHKFEIRLKSSLLHSKRKLPSYSDPKSPETYFDDLKIGIKYNALQYSNKKGILSFLLETNIPESRTGNHLNTSSWRPVLNAMSAYSFTDWFQLTAKLGHSISGDVIKYNFIHPQWALVSSFALNERFFLFSEWYGSLFSREDYQVASHKFDAGILYLINSDLQLDFSAGIGDLKKEIVDYKYHFSAGISWRTKFF